MINILIMEKIRTELEKALITDVDTSDPARAGIVMLGPLQGDPDPDEARISVTIHENDPDRLLGGGLGTSGFENWSDEVDMIEIGGGITWARRFTIKARALLVSTQENLTASRQIASVLKSRIEKTLLSIDFSDIEDEGESVAGGIFSDNIYTEMAQSGGPPDSYDFHLKIRFELLTYELAGGSQ